MLSMCIYIRILNYLLSHYVIHKINLVTLSGQLNPVGFLLFSDHTSFSSINML